MASFGKVLDLLDDRYLELQDVVGNIEPLPTLVPYEEYTQNVLVYRMNTNHEIVMGLIQDFTMRRAHETGIELWTWCVQWEIDNSPPMQQSSSPKKVRLDAQQGSAPATPRRAPAITIFERRTLDCALMLEEEMLRILIDIVQVASALVPNFIEFLYRWVDYYEGDGKALKAALRWEIPSLWDFECHPLVLKPNLGEEYDTKKRDNSQSGGKQENRTRSATYSKAAELRQSSPTENVYARSKPDLAAIELRTCYTEESERLQYREVRYGIQPPKLEQPLPPLINIPRDQRKRTKYYAACFKSRQRALYLLHEAGVTMRQINNYQKLQTAHPKDTSETGNGSGLSNYQKDAEYAQVQFELKEKQFKQREVAISSKLAVEAQFAASYAVPDGAASMPLIPPTPLSAKAPDMSAAMMERINVTREKMDERVNVVPKPLVGRMKSKIFENAGQEPLLKPVREFLADMNWYTSKPLIMPTREEYENLEARLDEILNSEEEGRTGEREYDNDEDKGIYMETDTGSEGEVDTGYFKGFGATVSTPNLPRPVLPRPSSAQLVPSSNTSDIQEHYSAQSGNTTPDTEPCYHFTPPSIATYMQNLDAEQIQHLLPLLSPEARQAVTSGLEESSRGLSHALEEKISETAEIVRSSADEQSGLEPAENRVMCEMLLSVPYCPLLSAQEISSQRQGRLSLVDNAVDFSIIPTLLPSSTSNTRVLTDQQSSNYITSEGAKSDVPSKFCQLSSESELQLESKSGAAVAGSLEKEVLTPFPSYQPTQIVSNTTEQRMEKQVNAQSGGTTSKFLPSGAVPPVEVQRHTSSNSRQSLFRAPTSVPGQPVPSLIGLQQYTTAQGSCTIPVYALLPTSVGSTSMNPQFTGFNADYFTYLRRQQEVSGPAISSKALPAQSILSDTHLTSQTQTITATGLYQQNVLCRQQTSSLDSTVDTYAHTDYLVQLETQPPLQPQIITSLQLSQQSTRRSTTPAFAYRQPSQPSPSLLTPLQPQLHFPQTASGPRAAHQIVYGSSPTPYPPSSTAMLPSPRPGIIRNAPSPLSLSPPMPSPFKTIAPQILATSPFLDLSSNAGTPIQIYLPKILVPGNGIGPSGVKMGNSGCIETDALLLGHEDIRGGKLVLSKAILLPVGIWENTLRKVRSGRWSVMETYACPPSHPGKSKGKGKMNGEGEGKDCHKAVYEKLSSAYGLMTQEAKRREEELTKRWRVSRGPMTSHDRGAVWEGWGVFVDRGIEMSSQERQDAVRNDGEAPIKFDDKGVIDDYGSHDDAGEAARRRKEIRELMDEDEEMND